MNRTMWARSPASAQRNPTRRCFTHSLLTALIVCPLPILTLCYLFSQQVLKMKFLYLKLSLTHSKTHFKLGDFWEQLKTELLFGVTLSPHPPSTPGEFLKCSFKVWSLLDFYLITGHHKRGKKPPLELWTNPGIKVEECRVWGAALWPPTTSLCTTINTEEADEEREEWEKRMSAIWCSVSTSDFWESKKRNKKEMKVSQLSHMTLPLPFLINAL